MDRGAWWATVQGGRKESDMTERLHFHFQAPNIGTTQYIRQALTDIKREIDSNTIIVGDFNTPPTPMDRSNRKLIKKYKS